MNGSRMRAHSLLMACLFPIGSTPLAASDTERLAVVFDLSPKVTNHHVGVTAFGNFEKHLDNDWQLDAKVRDEVQRALESLGVDYVIVEEYDREGMLGNACFGGWSGNMKDDCRQRLEPMLAANGATRLLDVSMGSGNFRNVAPNNAFGMGLYTRGTDRPNIATPYTFLFFQLYDAEGKPLKLSNPHACGVGPTENRSPWQRTIAEQTIDDLAWLRPKLERLIRVNVANAMSRLGLSDRAAPQCTRAGTPVEIEVAQP